MSVAHEEPNYMGVFWWLLALTISAPLATARATAD